ncbi:MAG: dihydrofolate reductase [Bacteroidia bacterium]
MRISLLVAASENNVIGKDNQLIWHISHDLKRFKMITMGHHIIMGRKTHESIGKALPGRINMVITRNKDYKAEGCVVVHSIEEAFLKSSEDNEIFVIGGEEIFKLTLPVADRIYYTCIHKNFEGDAYMPEITREEWLEVEMERRTEHPDFDYTYITYDRIIA